MYGAQGAAGGSAHRGQQQVKADRMTGQMFLDPLLATAVTTCSLTLVQSDSIVVVVVIFFFYLGLKKEEGGREQCHIGQVTSC